MACKPYLIGVGTLIPIRLFKLGIIDLVFIERDNELDGKIC